MGISSEHEFDKNDIIQSLQDAAAEHFIVPNQAAQASHSASASGQYPLLAGLVQHSAISGPRGLSLAVSAP